MPNGNLILCWYCQRPNEAKYAVCPQCGKSPKSEKPEEQPVAAADGFAALFTEELAPVPSPPAKVVCPRCSWRNPADAGFCGHCGASFVNQVRGPDPVSSGSLNVICPGCSRENPPGASFCNGCGNPLQPFRPAPPAPYYTPPSYKPEPRPLPEINNTFVWLLAVSPILSWVLVGVLAGAWRIPNALSLWWVPMVINIGLIALDLLQLAQQGERTDDFLLFAWLVPVYLFVRAEKLKQDATYAWVWLVLFIVSITPVVITIPGVPIVIQQHPAQPIPAPTFDPRELESD